MALSLSSLQQEKALTISRAAWLLYTFPEEDNWSSIEEFSYIQNAVTTAASLENTALLDDLPMADNSKDSMKHDPRGTNHANNSDDNIGSIFTWNREMKQKIKVFCDYEVLEEVGEHLTDVELVKTKEEANFWLICEQIKNFLTVPLNVRVCQFPYEGGYVRKDLLSLTVRRYCYIDKKPPIWWLPMYDLSTEFHLFSIEYNMRCQRRLPNNWILKPSVGTRAMGHRVIDRYDNFEEGMRTIGKFSPQYKALLHEDGPVGGCIGQLLVENPLLVNGIKFDMRVICLVRSYEPFEVYMHETYYARLANKVYDITKLQDMQVALTVCCYDEDLDIRNQQRRMTKEDIRINLLKDFPEMDWNYFDKGIEHLLYELFKGLGKSVGNYPNSSAYYAVDIIFDHSNINKPEAKLLEINFMGDWAGIEIVSKAPSDYHKFVNDVVVGLATKEVLDNNFRKLTPRN